MGYLVPILMRTKQISRLKLKEHHPITLVIGGCRSGKSRYALDAANAAGNGKKLFLATSVPTDPEMEKRVAAHQAERGSDWTTVEEPVKIYRVIENHSTDAGVILVDCLTLWTTNLIMAGFDEAGIRDQVSMLTASLAKSLCPVFLVTNEVGYGIVPENTLARQFRDLAGMVNQKAAQAAHRVVLTVAGIDVQIKPDTKAY